MDHELVGAVERALGWAGAAGLGGDFQHGCLASPPLLQRLLPLHRLLELLLRRSLTSPQVRLFRDGQELHPNIVLDSEITHRGQSLSMVNMQRLAAQLERGVTLVIDRVDTLDATMEVAARALQWWGRERVQANAYLTTHEADGFHLHWDDHDVIVMQIAGEKAWEVRGSARPFPLFRDTDRNLTAPEEVVWKGIMRAGDIMHIPRGYWHAAGRSGLGEGLSLHVTFGFAKRTGTSWAAWAADWTRDIELFRRDLIRTDLKEAQEQEAELAKELIALVGSRGTRMFLVQRDRECPPGRHVPWMSFLGPLVTVACVAGYPPELVAEDGRLNVYAAERRLGFPLSLEPVLRTLLSGHPVQVGGLEGIARQAVEVLVREGVCAPLTPELSTGYEGVVATLTLLSPFGGAC